MVLGGVIQKITKAQEDQKRDVLLSNVAKLSREEFIKKFTSKKIILGLNPEDKWWAGTTKFGNEKESGKYYDTVKAMQKTFEDERVEAKKDIKRLSKKDYIKKYSVYKYPDSKYKVNGESFYEIMGDLKYVKISHEEAEKIKNPGFLRSYFALAGYESLLIAPPDPEALGSVWEEENNKTSSKITSSEKNKNNLSDELEKLKKLYKDGTLSKEEFTKAKKKLLK